MRVATPETEALAIFARYGGLLTSPGAHLTETDWLADAAVQKAPLLRLLSLLTGNFTGNSTD